MYTLTDTPTTCCDVANYSSYLEINPFIKPSEVLVKCNYLSAKYYFVRVL